MESNIIPQGNGKGLLYKRYEEWKKSIPVSSWSYNNNSMSLIHLEKRRTKFMYIFPDKWLDDS